MKLLKSTCLGLGLACAVLSSSFANEKNYSFDVKSMSSNSKAKSDIFYGFISFAAGVLYSVANEGEPQSILGAMTLVPGAIKVTKGFNVLNAKKGKMPELDFYKEFRKLKMQLNTIVATETMPTNRPLVEFLNTIFMSTQDVGVVAKKALNISEKVGIIAKKDCMNLGKMTPENSDVKVGQLEERLNSGELHKEIVFILGADTNKNLIDFAYKVYMLEYFETYKKTFAEKDFR